MRGRAALAALLLLFPCPGRSEADGDPAAAGRAVAIAAIPVEVAASSLNGLGAGGAWILRSGDPAFGGFSGLLVEEGRLLAVSDRGAWLSAAIGIAGGALSLTDARMSPLRNGAGEELAGAAADAEALARFDGALLVGFERDHRIERHIGGGRTGGEIRQRSFEALPNNAGIEALASVADTLLALGEEETEGPGGRGFPVYAFGADGTLLAETRLPARSRHAITGADVGADGRLYTVQRHFSVLTGVSIRIVRYHLAGVPPLPVAASAEELAAFESASGIDNMEALALWQDGAGRTRLWLLSDDNFSAFQRTMLLDFVVAR